jgi:menaquinone-9 beta-reductase
MGTSCDVFIVGGGPAGLAGAIAARQKGLSVVVSDSLRPPIDKPCGEGLLPETVAALRQLGVVLPPFEGLAFSGIRFVDSGASIEARFPAATALGLRRTELHGRMVERAERCGVRLLWNNPVHSFSMGSVVTAKETIRARWIVGADGSRSRVRRWARLEPGSPVRHRFGFRRHYRCRPWSDKVEVHWSPHAQIYVTPVGASEVCVVSLSRNPDRLSDTIDRQSEIGQRLLGAELIGSERGAVTSMCRLRRVHRGNVALIGDASGSVDAITGDGLGLCFQHALALAEALAGNDLAGYQREHHRIARRPFWMGRLLLALDGRPWLRRRLFRALSSNPVLFQRLLALHVGSVSATYTASTLAVLGRDLLLTQQ